MLASPGRAMGDLIKGFKKKDKVPTERYVLVTSNKVKEAFPGL
jgi:hypothetical protein